MVSVFRGRERCNGFLYLGSTAMASRCQFRRGVLKRCGANALSTYTRPSSRQFLPRLNFRAYGSRPEPYLFLGTAYMARPTATKFPFKSWTLTSDSAVRLPTFTTVAVALRSPRLGRR